MQIVQPGKHRLSVQILILPAGYGLIPTSDGSSKSARHTRFVHKLCHGMQIYPYREAYAPRFGHAAERLSLASEVDLGHVGRGAWSLPFGRDTGLPAWRLGRLIEEVFVAVVIVQPGKVGTYLRKIR